MTHKEKVEAMLAEQGNQICRILELLEKKEPAKKSEEWIELPSRDGKSHLYPVKNIISLSGSGTYTLVHFFKSGSHSEVVLCHNLGYWENVFNDFGFLRLHRSRLINPDFIIDFNSGTHYLKLPFLLSFKVSAPHLQTLHVYFHNGHNSVG